MRRGLGCALMLAGAIAGFTAVGFLVAMAGLESNAEINWPLIGGMIVTGLVLYAVGMFLLTSIPSDTPRRWHIRRSRGSDFRD